VVLSTKFSGPSSENLTPARRMGGDGIINVVFSLEASSWRFPVPTSIT
jgi:hypothetical protein